MYFISIIHPKYRQTILSMFHPMNLNLLVYFAVELYHLTFDSLLTVKRYLYVEVISKSNLSS